MAASWKVSRAFTRQFSSASPFDKTATKEAGETANMWMKIFFFVAIPAIALGHLNSYLHSKDASEHQRPEFVPYEHMRIRTKRFPWGDGVKTLFHNPHTNALPNGYEDEQ